MRLWKTVACMLVLSSFAGSVGAYLDQELERKMDDLAPGEKVPVVICLTEQASENYLLSGTQNLSRSTRREELIQRLKDFSRVSQQEILDWLGIWEARGACEGIYSYWIFNGLRGSLEADVIRALSSDPRVAVICYDGEPMKPSSELTPLEGVAVLETPTDTSWASKQVRAPEVWRLGHKGQGIIVGVVDTGVNYGHLDLQNRLWHNEDEIPDNGVDDDSNGYIDDYIGYNFQARNGDPMDYDGHGTWCASIVLGDGSAGRLTGMAPEARVICCKWGSSGTVWEAFQYCAANGAHIVSASVGYLHGPTSVAARSICDNLLFLGVILSAAAGNGAHNNGDHEPAPYDIVSPGDVPSPWSSPGAKSGAITVGATAPGDVIASFSSWGPTEWTFSFPYDDYPYPPGLMKPDVCAPGVGVPGASHTGLGNYTFGDGTSAATPCNAGVMALMLSADSTLTPAQVDSILETTAVELGPPGKDSLYGAGRIDALMAVASSRMCWLSLLSNQILDGGTGDGDGRAEEGETDSLIVTYYNKALWRNATGASLTLDCSDPEISILKDISLLGAVASGDSASNLSDPFVFSVATGFEPRRVRFELTVSATPESYDTTDTITIMVGHPSVLLVDDDGGGVYETFFQDAFEVIDVVHDDWSVATMGNVGATLADYCLVVWFTGDAAESTLTASERASLESYLDGGGLLFLSGQNIGQDIGATTFYSDYLHASFLQATTNVHTLSGVPADEIGDGLSILTAGSPGAGNQTSQDIIAPLAGADSVIMYLPGDCAGVKYDSGTYRLVYLGFGFEGIASRPEIGYDNNWYVLRRVVKWLGCPEVGVEEGEVCAPLHPVERLLQVSPSPFSRGTEITLRLSEADALGRVHLAIYDASGRLVSKLLDGPTEPRITVSFDARSLPSGVYFCRLETESFSLSRQIVLVK